MILYVYIAPGQGLTTPWGWNFDVNRNILSLRSFVASFKKISLKSDFIKKKIMILYIYIAPGQGQTAPRGQSFDFNRNVLSLRSFVASFKKMPLKSDFNNSFHDLIHVYSPRAGVDSPQETKFLCQHFITLPFCSKFQRNLFAVWFYTIFFIFHDLIHIYSPQGTNFDVNSNFLSLRSSVACFKS